MPGFDGAGNYVRNYNWTQDAANAIPIMASRFDTEHNGFASGLSNVICRDGQSTISANIPFNGKKITGLGDATAAQDAINQQAGDARYGLASASALLANSTNPFTGLATFAAQPGFSATRITSAQSLPQNTVTTFIFNSEVFDTGAGHDPATGIFTCGTAGIYLFTAGVFLQNNDSVTATLNGVYLSKNNASSGAGSRFDFNLGTVVNGGTIAAGSNSFLTSCVAIISLAATDTVRVKIDVGAVDASSTFQALTTSYWMGRLLG